MSKTTYKKIQTYIDTITPKTIKFNPNDINIQDEHHCVIGIYSYPPDVNYAWLSNIATIPGVVMSIHVSPQNPTEIIKEINKSMSELKSIIDTDGRSSVVERSKEQYEDAKKLLRKIDSENQSVVNASVLIKVRANTKEDLLSKKKNIEAKLAAKGMRGRVLTYLQEEAYKAVSPFCELPPKIEEQVKRNMPIESLAASFPFVYSGINDGRGMMLGKDLHGGVCLVDFWIRNKSRTNSNILVIGMPGKGKSTVIKKKIVDNKAQGIKTIVIDPEREYKDICKKLKGKWINTSGGEGSSINPFQINLPPTDDEDEEDKLYDYSSGMSPLALHIQTLRTFFDLYLPELNLLQRSKLELAIEEVYEKISHITFETTEEELKKYKNTDYPIMKNLYDHLIQKHKENENDKDIELLQFLLRSAAVGADSQSYGYHTSINDDDELIVLDTHDLLVADNRIQQTQFFNILNWAWSVATKDRTEPVEQIVDECYLMVDPDNPKVIKYIRNANKRIRKYEGSLITITQNMNDFMEPEVRRYGQALVDNPTYKIIMGQGDQEVQTLKQLMSLSEEETRLLKKGNRGEGLLIAGDKRIAMKVELTLLEKELLGSGGGR